MIFSGISKKYIKKMLCDNSFFLDVRKCVTSTNTIMKEKAKNGAEEFSVLIAGKQTAGRGRMGRSFYSPCGSGIYMSVLLKPRNGKNPLFITTDAAVCCARVLERLSGEKAEIKWVNDIYIKEKKVCGILTEGAGVYAVLGIGINILPPQKGFPDEIKDRAGAVFEKSERHIKEKVIAELLREIKTVHNISDGQTLLNEYRNRSMLQGKTVSILKNISGEYVETETATVIGIADDYSLTVKYENGEIKNLNTGDVTIKI